MEILNKDRLIECRLRLGITKQEAARRIQVSQPAYLRYEAGTRNPSIHIINKMAEIFSTSTDYLIGKSAEANSEKIIIDRNASPSLYLLAEACKDLDEPQLSRILAYVKAFSEVEQDNKSITHD